MLRTILRMDNSDLSCGYVWCRQVDTQCKTVAFSTPDVVHVWVVTGHVANEAHMNVVGAKSMCRECRGSVRHVPILASFPGSAPTTTTAFAAPRLRMRQRKCRLRARHPRQGKQSTPSSATHCDTPSVRRSTSFSTSTSFHAHRR